MINVTNISATELLFIVYTSSNGFVGHAVIPGAYLRSLSSHTEIRLQGNDRMRYNPPTFGSPTSTITMVDTGDRFIRVDRVGT